MAPLVRTEVTENIAAAGTGATPWRPQPGTARTAGLGLAIGGACAAFGVITAVGGPLAGFGVLIGVSAAAYVLTDLMAGLYLMIAIMGLLPFATLPVKVAVTPTLIDCAMGAFLIVYLFQYMTGKRIRPRLILSDVFIALYMLFTVFSFIAGLGYAPLTTATLRRFTEMQLSIAFAIVLIDVIREPRTLRRIILALIAIGAVQALIGIGLWAISDVTAERLLNALGRFGYPQGGVIRYVEENPALAERAIGTWVDPNAYGGFLVIVGVLAGTQILTPHPVFGRRWLALVCFVPIALAILLTQSRAALVALAVAALFIAALRYRWVFPLLFVGGVLFVILPFTQPYVDRLIQGFTNQDLATQMRFGEYKDALILIGRYPLIGVGFTGAPDRDIYLGVSNMYLLIAGHSGLIGLGLFGLTVFESLRFGFYRWRVLLNRPDLLDIWLGSAAALAAALVIGIFDHYYANIEFSGAVLLFWMIVSLTCASARLADEPPPAVADSAGTAESAPQSLSGAPVDWVDGRAG